MEKKKILVADDELDSLGAIQRSLEANNYSVVVTSNAKEVLPIAQKEIPDVILLDIVMPDMNGYQICELLKQQESTKGIPIILLTGERLEPKSIVERCLKLGVESSLLKPTTVKELLGKISEVLQGS